MFAQNQRWRPDSYLVLLLGLTLFALTPLLAPGYFYSAHDGRHSVFFVAMFDEAIRDGVFWPIWAMHHVQGYGYPTFLLQAPLAFFVAEGFALVGFGITAAVKGAWAAAFLLGAWGMYGLVRRWVLTWPHRGASLVVTAEDERRASQAGLIAGLLYVYAPYHLLDIYVRAALAETMLIGWLPWVFWAFDRLIGGALQPGWQARLAVAAVAYALLIFTHAFAIIAVTPLLMVFILFRLWVQWRYDGVPARREWMAMAGQTAVAAAAGVTGLLLAAIFVLPLLAEGPLVLGLWLLGRSDRRQRWYEFSDRRDAGDPGRGCAFPALGADVAHAQPADLSAGGDCSAALYDDAGRGVAVAFGRAAGAAPIPVAAADAGDLRAQRARWAGNVAAARFSAAPAGRAPR